MFNTEVMEGGPGFFCAPAFLETVIPLEDKRAKALEFLLGLRQKRVNGKPMKVSVKRTELGLKKD